MGYYKLICILIVGFCLTVRTKHHWHCNNNIILKKIDIVSFAARSRVAVWIYKKVSPLLLVNNSTHLCATLPARRPCCCSVKLCERYPLCCWPSKLLLSTATPFPPLALYSPFTVWFFIYLHTLRGISIALTTYYWSIAAYVYTTQIQNILFLRALILQCSIRKRAIFCGSPSVIYGRFSTFNWKWPRAQRASSARLEYLFVGGPDIGTSKTDFIIGSWSFSAIFQWLNFSLLHMLRFNSFNQCSPAGLCWLRI